jgi:DNA primase
MTLIPDDLIDQVRESADLVGIVAEHVELKRTGADYRGPCPFHGGTHRNFAVIPKKGMYYCFVCHAGGDVFTFFMKKLGMDYPTAVREVARRAGIMIPDRAATAGPDPREPLFSALAAAGEWFARELREAAEGAAARDYLVGRGVDTESASMLGLGYAPRGAGFAAAMKELGLKEEVLLQAGLYAKREDGRIVARFRGRLLFPIHDLRGRVVGFGGRILGEGEPKYLNSPDTPVFHKGQLLYNLHSAKHGIRKAERAVLVEGYFDVLRLSGSGVEEVVAPLGTGLTADQAALLARYTKHVYLLYDPDPPGLRATFRAGDELLRHGLRVSVATLPEGQDPDALVQSRGKQALEQVLHDAVDVLERKIHILNVRGFFGTLPGRRRALDRLLPTLRAATDPITRELYLSRVAEVAGIRKDVLEREAGSGKRETSAPRPPTLPASRFPLPVLPAGAEKALLLLMLSGEPWKSRVREAVDPEEIDFPGYRTLFEALLDDAPDRLDEEAARTYERLREEGLGERDPDETFTAAVNWIEARRLAHEVDRLEREIPLAAEEEKVRLVMEKRRIVAEMNAKYPRYKIARRSSAPGS